VARSSGKIAAAATASRRTGGLWSLFPVPSDPLTVGLSAYLVLVSLLGGGYNNTNVSV
jgi:hypothetical protein